MYENHPTKTKLKRRFKKFIMNLYCLRADNVR